MQGGPQKCHLCLCSLEPHLGQMPPEWLDPQPPGSACGQTGAQQGQLPSGAPQKQVPASGALELRVALPGHLSPERTAPLHTALCLSVLQQDTDGGAQVAPAVLTCISCRYTALNRLNPSSAAKGGHRQACTCSSSSWLSVAQVRWQQPLAKAKFAITTVLQTFDTAEGIIYMPKDCQ